MMNHHIAAARFGRDKTEALLVVKPFHLPHRHLRSPVLSLRGLGRNHVAQKLPDFARRRPSSSTIPMQIAQHKPKRTSNHHFLAGKAVTISPPTYPHATPPVFFESRPHFLARQAAARRQDDIQTTIWPLR